MWIFVLLAVVLAVLAGQVLVKDKMVGGLLFLLAVLIGVSAGYNL